MKKITFLLLMLFASFAVSAQCINTTAYLTVTSNNNNVSQQIGTCTYSTEYNTINGIVVGEDYEFVATDAGTDVYVTITDLSNNVIASGPSPLTVSAITSSEVRLHVTADETCAGGSVCHVTSFRSTSFTCLQPTALTASNITTSGADLGWTENNTATSWNVEIVDVTAGGTQTMTATASGVTNPYTASGLTDANDYEFYVQADCGGGDLSPWEGPFAFTTIANCVDPSGLTISNVTTVSAEASWTENGTASVYNVELVNITAGGTQTMTATEAGVGNPHTFTGLSPNVDYEYYVLADCGATGGTGVSQWVGPFAFSTACSAIAAPYIEDFESFTTGSSAFIEGECWAGSGGSYYWESAPGTDTGSSDTGPDPSVTTGNYFYTEATSGSAGDITELTAPMVDLSALTAPALSFDYHMYGSVTGTLDVLVNGNVEYSISGQQQGAATDPFLNAVVDLSTYAGQTIQVVFRATSAGTYQGDMAIDNVSFDEAPSCIAPAGNVTVVDDCANSMFSIDVDVTNLGSATTVNIFDGTTSTPVTVTGVTTVGPYAFGSSINITLVHDTDNSCDADLGMYTEGICPPVNDACENAITINSGDSISGSTVGATNVENLTACSGGTVGTTCDPGGDSSPNGGFLVFGTGVWYVYNSPGNESISVEDSAGAFDSEIQVWSGACGSLVCVAGDDDSSNVGNGGFVCFDSEATPTTYYIYIDGNAATGTGAYTLNLNTTPIPVANDECTTAEALTLGVMATGDTSTATDSGVAAGSCGATGGDQDIWYSFVATSTMAVTVDTTADTVVIYDDTACTGGAEIACVGEGSTDVGGLTDGATYYARVYNSGIAKVAGPVNITISETTLSTRDFNGNTIFSYYPNPVNNTLTLNAQQAINNVTIFNMLGQEVIRTAPNAVSKDVDMSNLQSGTYFVQVTVGSAVETVKIIKN
ncbi:T9SS type A sorting domain-containing protein [Lacinutrix venerupis]|uniref:T9SS type A sorting domain-containing protein n=1 Tax=Lacinutrix venerupis TaxID=1486034 RepID=UPI000EAEE49C|nr:fibronectin type III domain-containing protein [Lacinutrix venerupis]